VSDNHTSSPEGFFYQPKTIKWILRVFYGLCVILVALDFIIHRHIATPIEKIPTFYGLFGFISCVILVLIANQIRKWVMRDEHYYAAESEQIKNEIIKRKAGNTNE
jgi:hypothetical protein